MAAGLWVAYRVEPSDSVVVSPHSPMPRPAVQLLYVVVATTIVQVGLAGYGPGRDESGVYFEVRDRQKASDPVAWLR